MEPTATTTPPPPPAAEDPCNANKRRRKAALPLRDVTNLLPDTSATTCSSSASVTPVSKPSSPAVVEEPSLVQSPISTVYTRRKAERRRRRVPAGTAASCPPLGKATGTNRKTSMHQDTRPISSSAPCGQAKKKRQTGMKNASSGKHTLPEDFVEKHRAYFQEIDAFELPEEEASETDLE